MLLTILAPAGEMKLPAPTYRGTFPKGYSGIAVLDTSGMPYVLADSGDRTVAYAMQSGVLVRKLDLPRLGTACTLHDSLRPCGFDLTGDIDGDRIDEFIIATNRSLEKYKMLNGTLALTTVDGIRLPSDSGRMWITDGYIGDIDNDGTNELLISATRLRPTACGGDSWGPVVLFVCRWDKDTMVQLWNDGGALKLEQPDFDYVYEFMLSVADPRNTGSNRLILLEANGDDVHAAEFRAVVWQDGRLTDDGHFELRNGALQWDHLSGDYNNAATGCQFYQVEGKTAIVADVFKADWGQEELFVFSGDTAVQHCVLWDGAQTAFLADLDGEGVGIVRMPNPDEDESSFVFYRLPSDWTRPQTNSK
jgi:hypothetical protein